MLSYLRTNPASGNRVLIGFLTCWLFVSCNNSNNKGPRESPTSGTINISVDESFRPVIDSQIKVFESSWPDAKIIPHYKPEAECLRDLTTDSTRMVIVTRGLSPDEMKFYEDSFHLSPSEKILAYDAITIIINNNSKDTVLEIKDIQNMLNGTDTKHQPVMDGLSATSTVRYAIDSILHGQPLGKNVAAARSSEEVINYVANNPHAVGFIGVSWVGDPGDPGDTSFVGKVKVAAVQCTSCLGGTHVKPFQANIALRRYPLVRSLYYILKENFSGIGNNFTNFLQYERGQLIFSKAYLWPAGMSFQIRNAEISK